jgi:hypothetical protein
MTKNVGVETLDYCAEIPRKPGNPSAVNSWLDFQVPGQAVFRRSNPFRNKAESAGYA